MRRMAATLAALVLTHGCGVPALEPWHIEKLTEEFSVAKADKIRSFDDYRLLEDRLFTSHMVGYSTGAALALDFALDAMEGEVSPEPPSLVLISPAIRIHAAAALARFKDALSVLPGLGHLAWLQILPGFDPYRYNSFAANAGDVVHRLTRSVDGRIARVRSRPLQTIRSTADASALRSLEGAKRMT